MQVLDEAYQRTYNVLTNQPLCRYYLGSTLLRTEAGAAAGQETLSTEVKVIFMGHAMAGKTSLNKRLSDEGADTELPAETDRTIGVDLGRLVIPFPAAAPSSGGSAALSAGAAAAGTGGGEAEGIWRTSRRKPCRRPSRWRTWRAACSRRRTR